MFSRMFYATFEYHDAFRLSTSWKQVLGNGNVPNDAYEPDMIVGRGEEPKLLFVEVFEDKQVTNHVHLE